MKCPRCHDVELVEGGALSSSTCPRCGGGLVPESGLSLLLDEIKCTRDELRELASQYGGQRFPCPACKTKVSPLVLRGAQIDLCFGCGSLWVDRGELEAISGNRHALPAPTKPAPAKSLAPPAQALVRVDERSVVRHAVRAALAGAGAVGVIWAVVGLVPVASGALALASLAASVALSRRDAFDVLPRARRMVRWRGFFAPDAKSGDGETFSADSCVVVRRLHIGERQLSWVAIDLVDPEGRTLARLRGPLLAQRAWTEAPRYARALGVLVRFDVDAAADDALDVAESERKDLPTLAAHDVVKVSPSAGNKLDVKSGDGKVIASIATDVALKGRPKNLDEMLAEHFVITDAGGEALRLFSTTQLGRRTTILVGKEGRVLGHVDVRRNIFADVYALAGPQARRSARVLLRHGATQARLVDGHGRGAGVLELGPSNPGEARPCTLHLFPGRLTGDARWGLVALAVHATLVAAVPDVE